MGQEEGRCKLMSSILDILAKIGASDIDYHGWVSKYCKPAITRREFTMILMDPTSNPSYQTTRTVSEKWRLLIELGYGKLKNADLMMLNLDKIRQDLGITIIDEDE